MVCMKVKGRLRIAVLPGSSGTCQQFVDLVDNPVEKPAVEGLGHGVSRGDCFLMAVVSHDTLSACDHGVQCQHLLQFLPVQAQQVRH